MSRNLPFSVMMMMHDDSKQTTSACIQQHLIVPRRKCRIFYGKHLSVGHRSMSISLLRLNNYWLQDFCFRNMCCLVFLKS